MTVVGVKKEITQMKEQLLTRSSREKPNGKSRQADDKNMSKNEGRNK